MASMVPYRSVFGVRPVVPASLFDAFDDMMDIASSPLASKTFPIDVEDKGDAYEVKAYLTGVSNIRDVLPPPRTVGSADF